MRDLFSYINEKQHLLRNDGDMAAKPTDSLSISCAAKELGCLGDWHAFRRMSFTKRQLYMSAPLYRNRKLMLVAELCIAVSFFLEMSMYMLPITIIPIVKNFSNLKQTWCHWLAAALILAYFATMVIMSVVIFRYKYRDDMESADIFDGYIMAAFLPTRFADIDGEERQYEEGGHDYIAAWEAAKYIDLDGALREGSIPDSQRGHKLQFLLKQEPKTSTLIRRASLVANIDEDTRIMLKAIEGDGSLWLKYRLAFFVDGVHSPRKHNTERACHMAAHALVLLLFCRGLLDFGLSQMSQRTSWCLVHKISIAMPAALCATLLAAVVIYNTWYYKSKREILGNIIKSKCVSDTIRNKYSGIKTIGKHDASPALLELALGHKTVKKVSRRHSLASNHSEPSKAMGCDVAEGIALGEEMINSIVDSGLASKQREGMLHVINDGMLDARGQAKLFMALNAHKSKLATQVEKAQYIINATRVVCISSMIVWFFKTDYCFSGVIRERVLGICAFAALGALSVICLASTALEIHFVNKKREAFFHSRVLYLQWKTYRRREFDELAAFNYKRVGFEHCTLSRHLYMLGDIGSNSTFMGGLFYSPCLDIADTSYAIIERFANHDMAILNPEFRNYIRQMQAKVVNALGDVHNKYEPQRILYAVIANQSMFALGMAIMLTDTVDTLVQSIDTNSPKFAISIVAICLGLLGIVTTSFLNYQYVKSARAQYADSVQWYINCRVARLIEHAAWTLNSQRGELGNKITADKNILSVIGNSQEKQALFFQKFEWSNARKSFEALTTDEATLTAFRDSYNRLSLPAKAKVLYACKTNDIRPGIWKTTADCFGAAFALLVGCGTYTISKLYNAMYIKSIVFVAIGCCALSLVATFAATVIACCVKQLEAQKTVQAVCDGQLLRDCHIWLADYAAHRTRELAQDGGLAQDSGYWLSDEFPRLGEAARSILSGNMEGHNDDFHATCLDDIAELQSVSSERSMFRGLLIKDAPSL